jgi:hypothetical protein
MKNNLILFISLGFVLITSQCIAQQVRVGRQSLNSLGSSTVSNGIRISHTVGQASSTSVSKSGNILIRQGFQQANTMQYEVEKTDFSVQLYPNPNDGNFNVSMTGIDVSDKMSYKVIDINGKKLQEFQSVNTTTIPVSLAGINPGIYYLILNSKGGKSASIKFTIR